MEFRPYQNEMDHAIYQELIIKNYDRCLVKAFCGTGKSIVMYKGKAFQNHDTLVYVFPSLSLIDQFKTDYLKSKDVEVFIISSDDESTTDEIEIKKFMKTKNKIICITYQSFHLLSEYKINMCVFDEAHHAVGETYQPLIFNNLNIEKSCFFTATPKRANGIDMEKDCNLIYEYSYPRGLSEGYLNPFEIRCDLMGDDSNKTIYESIARAYYTTGNNRILTFHSDVNTESPTSVRNFVNENEMIKAFKTIAKEISKETKKVIRIPKLKMIGFYSEIKLKERRQILNYFDSCKDKDVFILSSCETMGEGVDTKNANMCVFVDSKTSVIKIIQNIGRVVRKVFGVDKPHSTILLPIAINKTKYESCETAEECDALIREDMNKDGDFTSILNVLSALKQEDEDLYDICLHYPNEYSPQEIEENLKSQGYKIGEEVELDEVFERANINQHSCESEESDDEEEEKCCVDIHTNSLEEPIVSHGSGDKIINILKDGDNYYEIEGEGKINPPKQRIKLSVHTNSDIKVLWKVDEINFGSCLLDCEVIDNWNERLEELRNFLEKEKRRPDIKSEKNIANWMNNTFQNYKYFKKSMKNEIKRKIWEDFLEKYIEYLKTNDTKWNEKFTKLKEFIKLNKRRPSSKCTNKDEKSIGVFLLNQNKYYNTNLFDKIKIKLWEDFLKEYKEYLKSDHEIWFEKIENLQNFINIHKRRPNKKEELYSWLSHQIEKKESFKKERYDYFIKFLEKNKEYIEFNDVKWNETFTSLKEFIHINKRRPNKRTKNEQLLGTWLGNQNKTYNKNQMNEERIKIWKEFLKDNIYLKDIDEVWNDNFIKIKEFINIHKRRPNPSIKDKNEKFLGRWFGKNNSDFIQKKHGMKDENRYKIWEKFLKDNIYFKTDDELWNDNLHILKNFININKRKPKETIKEENKLRKWITTNNGNYREKKQGFINPNRCKQWKEFLEEYKEYFIEKKSMKFQEKVEKVEKQPKETPQQKIQRNKSELSQLHKDYKTKRSDNLHEEFQEDPELWHHYHKIAEANEETFPTESIPRNQIIQELEKIKMKRTHSKQVIDMGCGKAYISKHFQGDTRFKFTNIDHIAIDETVQSGDISKLSFEDDSVEICILSLAMWGSNCKEYISEAHRVLETNGTLYIIEPTKRWTNETSADRLKELLNNFTIKKEIIEKFTMFVAIKN